MKFSMCILICMGSICIVFGGWGTSTFFIFFRFCSIFVTCFLCYCALLLTAGETDLVLYYVFWLAQDIFSRCNLVYVLIHEITTRFLNDIFLKKIGFFSKILCRDFWEFSDLNQSENSLQWRLSLKNVVSPLKIIIFEKVIIYEIAASSWYPWYLSC